MSGVSCIGEVAPGCRPRSVHPLPRTQILPGAPRAVPGQQIIFPYLPHGGGGGWEGKGLLPCLGTRYPLKQAGWVCAMWQVCCKCSVCPEDAWGRHSPSGRMGKQSPLGFRGSPWEGLGGPGPGKDDSQGLGWENRLAILWVSWWVTSSSSADIASTPDHLLCTSALPTSRLPLTAPSDPLSLQGQTPGGELVTVDRPEGG